RPVATGTVLAKQGPAVARVARGRRPFAGAGRLLGGFGGAGGIGLGRTGQKDDRQGGKREGLRPHVTSLSTPARRRAYLRRRAGVRTASGARLHEEPDERSRGEPRIRSLFRGDRPFLVVDVCAPRVG